MIDNNNYMEGLMTVIELAVDSGRSDMTIRRWIRAERIPFKRIGLREIFVEPADWEKFCSDNNIKRKGGRIK